MIYTGWVPNVTGHLSFSTIGITSHPTRSRRVVGSTKTVVVQKRDLLDVIVPFLGNDKASSYFREFISNRIVGISGNFTFICLYDTPLPNGNLKGDIYLLSNAKRGPACKAIWKNAATGNDNLEESNESILNILKEAKLNSIVHALFSLERGGKFTLELQESSGSEVDDITANQFFYFFKDISHVHQHHDPSHDAITELTRFNNSLPKQWAADTQHSLYRAVIRYKRFRNEKALFRASGILSYASSFETSYEDTIPELKKFNKDDLGSSLSVSRAEIQHFDQKSVARIETTRNLFFALFGFILSVVALARLDEDFTVKPDPFITQIASYISTKPAAIAATALIISYVYSLITHRRDPAKFSVVKNTLRLLQGLRMRWFFLANLVISAVLSALVYLLMKPFFL
ncbi:hypothetical protein [Limimaricola cinnabarinus]|uniref:hypothetical protein n=1 Tax=Limimaricola cinnabarinus TaxID=1125964 RepID=UPI002FE0228A